MQLLNSIRDYKYNVLALATVLAFTAEEAAAGPTAGKDIAGVASTAFDQIKSVGELTLGASFLVGVIMVAGGLMKLKQSSENQGQNPPYSAGLWRLGLGAGLVALPAITTVMVKSGGLAGNGPSGLSASPF